MAGNGRGKKGGRKAARSGGRKSAGTKAETPGGNNSLVAWNSEMRLTDSLRLPVVPEQIFTVTQGFTASSWLTASITPTVVVGANYTALLSQFSDNLSAFTSLFDQYRFNSIEVWVKPQGGFIGQQSEAAGSSTTLYTMLDYDSSTAPTSVSAANGYATVIESPVGESQRRCFRPRIAYAAYGSSVFTSFANQQAGWIDCASTAVAHYGMLACCTAAPAGTAGNLPSWDLQVRANISFRSTH
jgi:hypothetical protein